jgi:hypothetical protein
VRGKQSAVCLKEQRESVNELQQQSIETAKKKNIQNLNNYGLCTLNEKWWVSEFVIDFRGASGLVDGFYSEHYT